MKERRISLASRVQGVAEVKVISMAEIVIAGPETPLRVFLQEQLEAAGGGCRLVDETAELSGVTGDLLLLDAGWAHEKPTGIACLLYGEPVSVVAEEGEQMAVRLTGKRLQLPVSTVELLRQIEAAGGCNLISSPGAEDAGQGSGKEDKEMVKKIENGPEVIELTEIVEEGLPLDQLPDVPVGEDEAAQPGIAAEEIEELSGDDDFGASLNDLEGSLEELEKGADQEMVSSGKEETAPVDDEPIVGDPEALLDDDDFAEVEITAPRSADTAAPAAVTVSAKPSPEDEACDSLEELEELVAGQEPETVAGEGSSGSVDSLAHTAEETLGESGTAREMNVSGEVRFDETDDPVLAELKEAGLTPSPEEAGEALPVSNKETVAFENDVEPFATGRKTLAGSDGPAESPVVAAATGEEPVADTDAAAVADDGDGDPLAGLDDEVIVMSDSEVSGSQPVPEPVDETVEKAEDSGLPPAAPEEPPVVAETPETAAPEIAGEPVGAGAETWDERPEDYLVDELEEFDPPAAASGSGIAANGAEAALGAALTAAAEPQPVSPAATSRRRPEICPEPQMPDFSRQIENLTREWSKQLLQSTYASMDKMIQAIGDLAPTIVDRVAREIIPPLAEQVIKTEIARLEKKLEEEEAATAGDAPPAVAAPQEEKPEDKKEE